MAASLQRARRHVDVLVGGRYGLGSKDFTPAMALAVFENLAVPRVEDVRDGFVVGINDDVSFSSLHYSAGPDVLPPGTTECQFWWVGLWRQGFVGHMAVWCGWLLACWVRWPAGRTYRPSSRSLKPIVAVCTAQGHGL